MTAQPTITDVTRRNPIHVIYVRGSEFVDGSLRYISVPGEGIILAEQRVAGFWVPADIQFSQSTWLVDDNLGEYILDENGEQIYEG